MTYDLFGSQVKQSHSPVTELHDTADEDLQITVRGDE